MVELPALVPAAPVFPVAAPVLPAAAPVLPAVAPVFPVAPVAAAPPVSLELEPESLSPAPPLLEVELAAEESVLALLVVDVVAVVSLDAEAAGATA